MQIVANRIEEMKNPAKRMKLLEVQNIHHDELPINDRFRIVYEENDSEIETNTEEKKEETEKIEEVNKKEAICLEKQESIISLDIDIQHEDKIQEENVGLEISSEIEVKDKNDGTESIKEVIMAFDEKIESELSIEIEAKEENDGNKNIKEVTMAFDEKLEPELEEKEEHEPEKASLQIVEDIIIYEEKIEMRKVEESRGKT